MGQVEVNPPSFNDGIEYTLNDFKSQFKKITLIPDVQNSLPLFVLGRPHDNHPQTYGWFAENKA